MHDLARRLKRLVQTREMLLRRCQLLATVFQTMQIVEDGSDADVLRYEVDDVQSFFSVFLLTFYFIARRTQRIRRCHEFRSRREWKWGCANAAATKRPKNRGVHRRGYRS